MGLLSTIKEALGLVPPVTPRAPRPFDLTRAAARRLRGLSGRSVRVTAQPKNGVHVITVQELDTPAPPELEFPLLVSDEDEARLAGTILDYEGGWRVFASVDVRPLETPNPEVRLYECSRFLIDGRPLHIPEGDRGVGIAAELMALPGVKSLLIREHTASVERVEGARWDELDGQVPAVIRAWFSAAGGPISQEEVGRSADPAYAAIAAFIHDKVSPYVHQHGGDIQLVDIEDGVVRVALHGACATCPASMLTLKGGVQRQLVEAFPDLVERVEAVG